MAITDPSITDGRMYGADRRTRSPLVARSSHDRAASWLLLWVVRSGRARLRSRAIHSVAAVMLLWPPMRRVLIARPSLSSFLCKVG